MCVSIQKREAARVFIFDFDGVLVNTESAKAAAWKRILAEYGVPNGDLWYKQRMGRVRLDLCKEAIQSFNLGLSNNIAFLQFLYFHFSLKHNIYIYIYKYQN